MKKLLIVRHASAAHEKGYIDFERPLTLMGKLDAETMAGRLRAHGHVPQRLISSPAIRAKSTANIFSELLSLPAPETNKHIYDAGQETLLHVINEFPGDYDFIALVGHNPGVAQLAYYFTGQAIEMYTCGLALIEFEADSWKELSIDSGKLVYTDSPG